MEQKNHEEIKSLMQQLSKKMDILVALLLRLIPKDRDTLSLKEQVRFLDSLKIRPVDISKITGRTQGHINKELASIRKGK